MKRNKPIQLLFPTGSIMSYLSLMILSFKGRAFVVCPYDPCTDFSYSDLNKKPGFPMIVDDLVVMGYEIANILHYLDKRAPSPELYPCDLETSFMMMGYNSVFLHKIEALHDLYLDHRDPAIFKNDFLKWILQCEATHKVVNATFKEVCSLHLGYLSVLLFLEEIGAGMDGFESCPEFIKMTSFAVNSPFYSRAIEALQKGKARATVTCRAA